MFKLNILLIVFLFTSIISFTPSYVFSKNYINGQVIKVNVDSNTVILRIGGRPINLDVSNASFKGYGNINDIKTGDWLKIVYTPLGARVLKSSKKQSEVKQTEVIEEKVTRKKKQRLQAKFERPKTQGYSFRDIDNNKDGKITPVELSVIMPNITMEKFKEYDKNGDGYLDASEYLVILRNR